ncbi:MAG: hypothetical protein ACI93R_003191 [Flavobacteriales bacterium]|jgi:hypothetical protein
MGIFKVRDVVYFRRNDRSIHARAAVSLFIVALLVSCGGEEGKQGVSCAPGNVGAPGQVGPSSLVVQTPLAPSVLQEGCESTRALIPTLIRCCLKVRSQMKTLPATAPNFVT